MQRKENTVYVAVVDVTGQEIELPKKDNENGTPEKNDIL